MSELWGFGLRFWIKSPLRMWSWDGVSWATLRVDYAALPGGRESLLVTYVLHGSPPMCGEASNSDITVPRLCDMGTFNPEKV